jgi:holo-[acyl-carrier protein] synthase
MILGIGSDLIDIRRIEQTLDRFGDRFIDRLFTDIERQRSEPRAGVVRNTGRAASYAKRFAAKEACAKALGTGFRRGVFWRDLGVVNSPDGKPTLELTGEARQRLNTLTPAGMIAEIHLTLTDDYPLAQAFVIISAVPDGAPATIVQSTVPFP